MGWKACGGEAKCKYSLITETKYSYAKSLILRIKLSRFIFHSKRSRLNPEPGWPERHGGGENKCKYSLMKDGFSCLLIDITHKN